MAQDLSVDEVVAMLNELFVGEFQKVDKSNFYAHQLSYSTDDNQIVGLGINDTAIGNNQLKTIANIISNHCPYLAELSIRDSEITNLTPLKYLSSVKTLDISHNPIEQQQIDEVIPTLNLSTLEAARCKINNLNFITTQANLTGLYLHSNQITDMNPLINAPNILKVDLAYNQISTIPKVLINQQRPIVLSLDDYITQGSTIRLEDNPITTPPLEIVAQGTTAMLSYYQELEGEIKDSTSHDSNQLVKNHLFEAKMLVIGEPGAGKTSLVRKVQNPQAILPKENETTHGIDVLNYHFTIHGDNFPNFPDPKAIEGKDFRVNLWDFGGQEIYKATHRFFLSHSALYALVSDSRNEDTDFNYWLHIVEMFGGNSPVIIILNEKHQRERNFDADAMRQRFNNIQDILSVDLSSDEHERLNQIRLAIRQKISALPHVGSPVPGKWIDIRNHLEALPDNTITHDNYIEICKQYGITTKKDALILSQYFHDIGVFLHFQHDAILKHTLFLKPNWATNAIYKVLDDVNLQQHGGLLLKQQAKAIWHEAEFIDLCDEFLQLMQKFHLAFALKNTHARNSAINNSENQPQYIVPAKLPTKQPDYPWASQHDNQSEHQRDNLQNIMLRYKYDEFMPKGLLFHLMVELHHLIDSKDDVWRRGMLLHKNSATAEVIEAYAARDIKIRIKGQNGRDLLIIIMDKLDEINRQYNKLKVEKLIPCHCNICQPLDEPHFYEYSNLEQRKLDKKSTAECQKSYQDISVDKLLNTITATPQPDVSKPIVRDQVFISYSHKDVDMLETIQTHFKVLENEGINIKLWDDSAINAGDQWFEEIKSNLAKTKVFVLLVSTDFLASEFIAKHELPNIIEAMEHQGAKILSLILKPCRYTKHKVLKKIQSVNKPDRPLSGLSEHEQDQEILKLIEAIETNQLSDK